MDQVLSHRLIRSAPSTDLGKGPATKLDEFSGKFQTAFDPPPHFWKIVLQIFYNGYGRIYARRHRPDSIS